MKINNVNDILPQPTGATPRETGASRANADVAPPSAQVTLSPLSSQLSQVDTGVKGAEPAFNAQRVAEVRRRIEDGTYPVDILRIADGMASQVVLSAEPKES